MACDTEGRPRVITNNAKKLLQSWWQQLYHCTKINMNNVMVIVCVSVVLRNKISPLEVRIIQELKPLRPEMSRKLMLAVVELLVDCCCRVLFL